MSYTVFSFGTVHIMGSQGYTESILENDAMMTSSLINLIKLILYNHSML